MLGFQLGIPLICDEGVAMELAEVKLPGIPLCMMLGLVLGDELGLKLVIPLGYMEGDVEAILLEYPEGELLGLELFELLGRTL